MKHKFFLSLLLALVPVGSGTCNAKLHKAEGKAKDGADGEACTRQKENERTCQTKCG